jgi:hypothetical protein
VSEKWWSVVVEVGGDGLWEILGEWVGRAGGSVYSSLVARVLGSRWPGFGRLGIKGDARAREKLRSCSEEVVEFGVVAGLAEAVLMLRDSERRHWIEERDSCWLMVWGSRAALLLSLNGVIEVVEQEVATDLVDDSDSEGRRIVAVLVFEYAGGVEGRSTTTVELREGNQEVLMILVLAAAWLNGRETSGLRISDDLVLVFCRSDKNTESRDSAALPWVLRWEVDFFTSSMLCMVLTSAVSAAFIVHCDGLDGAVWLWMALSGGTLALGDGRVWWIGGGRSVGATLELLDMMGDDKGGWWVERSFGNWL